MNPDLQDADDPVSKLDRMAMMVDTEKTGEGRKRERTAGSRLRLLDFDDLFLLGHLLDGETVAATARHLGLTQPAITQRIRKIERVFGQPILQKAGRHVKLTPHGFEVCNRAADALALMRGPTTADTSILQVAALPYLADWLYQRIAREDFTLKWDLTVGCETELVERLESNAIHAALVEDAARFASYHRDVIDEEECLLVASPEMALQFDRSGQQCVFFDRNASMPWLQRIDSAFRARRDFSSVQVLGMETLILKAVVQGRGLAVLPRRLVEAQLVAGQLVSVHSNVDIEPLQLILVYRQDARLLPGLDTLLAKLRK